MRRSKYLWLYFTYGFISLLFCVLISLSWFCHRKVYYRFFSFNKTRSKHQVNHFHHPCVTVISLTNLERRALMCWVCEWVCEPNQNPKQPRKSHFEVHRVKQVQSVAQCAVWPTRCDHVGPKVWPWSPLRSLVWLHTCAPCPRPLVPMSLGVKGRWAGRKRKPCYTFNTTFCLIQQTFSFNCFFLSFFILYSLSFLCFCLFDCCFASWPVLCTSYCAS